MELWFTSDSHFHHTNIIRYCNRPFKDAAEMNEILLQKWNSCVKPQDHVYHLGDVTMERDNRGDGLAILGRMHGHKRLILGNHDHYAMKHYLVYFEKVMAVQNMDRIEFSHFPIHPLSMGNYIANVHGHTHNKPNYEPVLRVDKTTGKVWVQPYVNISCERTDYRPITFGEVKDLIKAEIRKWSEDGKTDSLPKREGTEKAEEA